MTLDDLREAQRGLQGVAERTPLVVLDATTRLKAEFLQPIHAFKIRGAWTALRRLPAEARARGVVTSSSGNHGLGVAYAARRLGVRAVVVMPESAAGVKIDGVRALGAEVLLVGKTRGPEQTAAAERLVHDDGLAMIPPFDYPDVIAGQGTVGMEILEDWPEVDTIVAPVGGGGLIAGISCAVRALKPGVTVIAAEPALVPKLSAAIEHGKPTTIPGGASLADGLLSKSIGQVTWPLIRETVREAITVTEDEIVAAVRWLAARGMRVEPSGAVTTAAWLSHRDRIHGNAALVCTGGNVDPVRYAELCRLMSAPRILLATEDTALARTLSWVLKENGYEVVTALDGGELIERLEQDEYELLVADLAEPDAGMLDRLSRLREDVRHRHIPLFVLTSPGFDAARLDAFGLGPSDIVSRPYRVRELLARIKAHLRVGRELNKARAEARSRTELMAILKEVTTSLNTEEIYQILVRRVAAGLRIARCSVVLAGTADTEGTVVAAYENPTLRDLRVDLNKYPEITKALATSQTVMVTDVDADPLYQDVRATWGSEASTQRTRSVIALPFALNGRTAGVFFLRTTADDPPLNRLDLGFAEQVIEAAVTALEKAYDLEQQTDGASQLRELADTDALTGCANRRVLDRRLGEELDRARRYDQVVTVVLLDVDDFKRINDTYGHQAGDRVLKQLATLLRRELRTMDFLARYGGEEFVVILPETGGTGARLFADRILRRVAQHNFADAAEPVWVTVSAGIATFPDDRAADDEALMRLADEHLYKAKRAGRNRYRD